MKKYIHVTNRPNTQTRIQREIRTDQILRRESSERSIPDKYSDANPARDPHQPNTQTRIQRSDSRLKKEDVFRGAGFPPAGSRNRQKISDVAGMAGFEPTISESKSGVLPLHYIPISGQNQRGSGSLPIPDFVGWVKGFEPSTPGTTIRCSPD